MSAWTEKYLHFGNRASSRAEGAHAKLKRYLKVSNGNLRQVKNKICLAIENEFQEIKTQLQSEKLRIPQRYNIIFFNFGIDTTHMSIFMYIKYIYFSFHMYNISYFKNILNHVSMFALKKLHSQYEKANLGTANHVCTGSFLATMGLPCAHKMNFEKEKCLQIHHIHPQWRIDTISLTSRGSLDEANVDETNADDDEMKDLLAKLYERYQHWPNFQRGEVKRRIFTILNMEEPLVNEPNIQTRKKRKVKSKKGHGLSSTKRDLSQFEIVEAGWMRKQQ